jgi:hypothetical protein
MKKQLSLFEQNYLDEFVPVVHWSGRDFTTIYFTDYSICRRGIVRNNITGKIITGSTNSVGYSVTQLKQNNKTYGLLMHRLVACTFLKCNDRQNLTQVNHIDRNKKNNHIFNLEWCTGSENMKSIFEQNENQLKLL